MALVNGPSAVAVPGPSTNAKLSGPVVVQPGPMSMPLKPTHVALANPIPPIVAAPVAMTIPVAAAVFSRPLGILSLR